MDEILNRPLPTTIIRTSHRARPRVASVSWLSPAVDRLSLWHPQTLRRRDRQGVPQADSRTIGASAPAILAADITTGTASACARALVRRVQVSDAASAGTVRPSQREPGSPQMVSYSATSGSPLLACRRRWGAGCVCRPRGTSGSVSERGWAVRRGWASPAAWDDIDTDVEPMGVASTARAPMKPQRLTIPAPAPWINANARDHWTRRAA